MKLSNRTYDILIWIAQILLPAAATLYAGLAELWTLPYGTQVGATIMLIDTFLGTILKISNTKYQNRDTEAEGLAMMEELAKQDDYIGEAYEAVKADE